MTRRSGASPEQEAPATAAHVLAVHRGLITGPEADAVLASYFAPGPEPRYDTPAAAAAARLAGLEEFLGMPQGPECPPDPESTEPEAEA